MHYVCSKGEGFFTRVLLSCWAISQMCPKSRPVVFSAVFETRGRIPFSLSPYHKFSLHLRECIKKSYILLLLPPQPSLQINYLSCNLPTKARRNSYRLFARPTPAAGPVCAQSYTLRQSRSAPSLSTPNGRGGAARRSEKDVYSRNLSCNIFVCSALHLLLVCRFFP